MISEHRNANKNLADGSKKMKKIIEFALIIFVGLVFSSTAFADATVTVTWTPSDDNNLATQECTMDGVVMKTVLAADPPTCTFNVTELKNQVIAIVSRNTQGAHSEFIAGTLFPTPSNASNGLITTQSFTP
jgi:hypothetical protein